MAVDIGQRVERVLERYNAKRSEFRREREKSKEATAHNKFLEEVPVLSAKIERAIADFNDMASDTTLRVTKYVDNAPHFSVIIYKISAVGIFDPDMELSLTVDHDGNVIGFICGGKDTHRLVKMPMFDLTEAKVFEMILELVERELDAHHF